LASCGHYARHPADLVAAAATFVLLAGPRPPTAFILDRNIRTGRLEDAITADGVYRWCGLFGSARGLIGAQALRATGATKSLSASIRPVRIRTTDPLGAGQKKGVPDDAARWSDRSGQGMKLQGENP
jgi:hypothetical protein